MNDNNLPGMNPMPGQLLENVTPVVSQPESVTPVAPAVETPAAPVMPTPVAGQVVNVANGVETPSSEATLNSRIREEINAANAGIISDHDMRQASDAFQTFIDAGLAPEEPAAPAPVVETPVAENPVPAEPVTYATAQDALADARSLINDPAAPTVETPVAPATPEPLYPATPEMEGGIEAPSVPAGVMTGTPAPVVEPEPLYPAATEMEGGIEAPSVPVTPIAPVETPVVEMPTPVAGQVVNVANGVETPSSEDTLSSRIKEEINLANAGIKSDHDMRQASDAFQTFIDAGLAPEEPAVEVNREVEVVPVVEPGSKVESVSTMDAANIAAGIDGRDFIQAEPSAQAFIENGPTDLEKELEDKEQEALNAAFIDTPEEKGKLLLDGLYPMDANGKRQGMPEYLANYERDINDTLDKKEGITGLGTPEEEEEKEKKKIIPVVLFKKAKDALLQKIKDNKNIVRLAATVAAIAALVSGCVQMHKKPVEPADDLEPNTESLDPDHDQKYTPSKDTKTVLPDGRVVEWGPSTPTPAPQGQTNPQPSTPTPVETPTPGQTDPQPSTPTPEQTNPQPGNTDPEPDKPTPGPGETTPTPNPNPDPTPDPIPDPIPTPGPEDLTDPIPEEKEPGVVDFEKGDEVFALKTENPEGKYVQTDANGVDISGEKVVQPGSVTQLDDQGEVVEHVQGESVFVADEDSMKDHNITDVNDITDTSLIVPFENQQGEAISGVITDSGSQVFETDGNGNLQYDGVAGTLGGFTDANGIQTNLVQPVENVVHEDVPTTPSEPSTVVNSAETQATVDQGALDALGDFMNTTQAAGQAQTAAPAQEAVEVATQSAPEITPAAPVVEQTTPAPVETPAAAPMDLSNDGSLDALFGSFGGTLEDVSEDLNSGHGLGM